MEISKQAHSLTEGVRIQQQALSDLFSQPMAELAAQCASTKMNSQKIELLLLAALPVLFSCKNIFVLNDQFVQITKNITRQGSDAEHLGRDRRGRPYLVNIVGHTDFKLSEAYISRRKHRPSLTAIQVIRNQQGDLIGFLGADFDMRELPHTEHLYKEPDNWHQMKGDPAIRRGLFYQQRVNSIMDDNIDDAFETMNELITEYGVFHGKFHFSSNRATVWHRDDPYVYHLLTINELTSANIYLAYPKRPYFKRAQVPIDEVKLIFDIFKKLRFADNNIYLRSGSLNIVNGMVGLNFSCDGSHYMRFDEFLDKNIDFWFGEINV